MREEEEVAVGKQSVVDKAIKPMSTTTLTNLTPALVTSGTPYTQLGSLPIGYYKGAAAFWDLDLAVNQPNVLAERQHILGNLDGREEDYDLQTLAITLAEAIGTAHVATLTVPAGEVWFVNSVLTTIPASGGANVITANWNCSLWTDRVGTAAAGQPFHPVPFNFGVGGGAQQDEFQAPGPVWLITNKSVELRLPAGTIITVSFLNTVAVAAATVAATFQLYGWVGKTLVA